MDKPLGQSREDYLERILMLMQHGKVRITDLARELQVAKSSAVSAVQRLAEDGFLKHDKYGDIQLTDQGSEIAGDMLNRHRMLKSFLFRVLKVPEDIAERDACAIEHHLSPQTLEKLSRYMAFLQHQDLARSTYEQSLDHDDSEDSLIDLRDVPPGGTARIVGFRGQNTEYRQKLLALGLFKGQVLTVVRRAPLGDPVQICVDGNNLTLRKHEALELLLRAM